MKRDTNSAGGRLGPCASGDTGWASAGTIRGPTRLAEYRLRQQHIRFWLEWDRGTMYVRDLAIKFTSYAHFVGSCEWMREDARVPLLVCVAPDITQERRIQQVDQPTLSHTTGWSCGQQRKCCSMNRGRWHPFGYGVWHGPVRHFW